MHVSIIVPVLNEAALIDVFLGHLATETPDAEIIVADGGSADDTAARAARRARVIAAPRGRARQMNAGAAAASGDIFWFLHADSRLPPARSPPSTPLSRRRRWRAAASGSVFPSAISSIA